MKQSLSLAALLIKDYDEAIDFYINKLGLELSEDTPMQELGKRWGIVAHPGASESRLLLARAVGDERLSRVGNQTGGRVFLFLPTDDFWRDDQSFCERGVTFVRQPCEESYGTVAVF